MGSGGLTVYFDTSFFVWLANASDEVAARVVDALNRRGVRYVVSFTHACELGRCIGNQDADARLVERLARIGRSPMLLEDVDLSVLRVSGDARAEIVNILEKSLPRITRARAHAVLLARWLNNLPRTDRPRDDAVLRTIGLLREDGTPATPEEALAYPPIASTLARMDAAPVDLASPAAAEEWSRSVMAKIASLAGSAFVERLQIEQSVGASALATDNRIFDAILNPQDQHASRKLGNTMRDVEHMAWFIQNQQEIDLLQVDGAQLRLIRARSEHPLSRLATAGRVFAATNLEEAVAAIEHVAESAT